MFSNTFSVPFLFFSSETPVKHILDNSIVFHSTLMFCFVFILFLHPPTLHICCICTTGFLYTWFFLLILPYCSAISGCHLGSLQQQWVANDITNSSKLYIYYFRFPLNLENVQKKKLLHISYRVVNERKINISLQAFIIISEVKTVS